ncbi:MAG: hypothetical protein GC206_03535 [Alphaproteobacteria bacterium]|nr:hypothetical protein [Alphaproteobacteria bacterium]
MQDEAPPPTDAPSRAHAAAWEDVSGGLHQSRPHPAHAAHPADPFDAFASGHDLTGDFADTPCSDDVYALLDDAGGRFRIDPDSGVVRLSDALLLREEYGRVHSVRIRAPGGYEAAFDLRIAAPLPEAVDANGEALFAGPDALTEPAPVSPAYDWSTIAAALGALRARTAPSAHAPFGAALVVAPETLAALDGAPAPLSLDAPLPSLAGEDAIWSAA